MLQINAIFAAILISTSLGAAAHGDESHKKTAAIKKEQKDWGIAGDANAATRTIEIKMSDNMRFTPDRIEIRQGEVIRFVVRNEGKMLHELVIGTKKVLDEHAALMVKFPTMEHDEPYMAHVKPGAGGEMIWNFNRPGEFDFACLIAGHYQAGMTGKITVATGAVASLQAAAQTQAAAPPASKTAVPADMVDAEVRKVDVENRRITLKHGEIRNLDMPPMTMVFQVSDPALLANVKAGDKVRFKAANDAGKFTVTEIQPAKKARDE